ncbi:MAG: adenylate kinase [Clostridiales bacterium]|jgi:adenylate kinase|nr:adenylate kinase [Clostridiales bacterium]
MVLILMGAPGAGKGSQSRELARRFGLTQISTGDILRGHMADGTEIGVRITDMMNAGELVPDDLIVGIVRERVREGDCRDGFILDGFPRTLAQAKALPGILAETGNVLDTVISIEVPDAVILYRMNGRLVCPACGAMFHVHYYPPRKAGVCDSCGSALTLREDDKAHTVLSRLATYHERTQPIIDYYGGEGLLLRVDGVGDKAAITAEIVSGLEAGVKWPK